MRIRDAAPDDTQELATVLGAPERAVAEMLHARTVRVGVESSEQIVGVVSFDVTEDAVRIARLSGDPTQYHELLEEPLRFGGDADLPVEMAVPHNEQETIDALTSAGFEAIEQGPTFRDTETAIYRRGANQ